MKITVLIDNYVNLSGLKAEHGLSFLIEKDGKRILFDCGQSAQLIENSKKLGLDLEGLDFIVLSHGHYDHCGALLQIIKKNQGIPVYGHPDIFDKKYKNNRYIGIGDRKIYKDAGARLLLSSKPIRIMQGVYTTGEVPRTSPEDNEEGFFKQVGSGYIKDEILDDISLILEEEEGNILLMGCAHSGILNILCKASELSEKDRFLLVSGGMHYFKRNGDYVQKMLKKIKNYNIDNIMPLHCSGVNHYHLFKKYFGKRLVYGSTGKTVRF